MPLSLIPLPRRARMVAAALMSASVLSGCGRSPATPEVDPRLSLFAGECANPAPLHLTRGEKVPDHFIVVYADTVTNPDARTSALAAQYGFTTTHRYQHALKGFAATLSPATVASLRCERDVKYIEEDAVVRVG